MIELLSEKFLNFIIEERDENPSSSFAKSIGNMMRLAPLEEPSWNDTETIFDKTRNILLGETELKENDKLMHDFVQNFPYLDAIEAHEAEDKNSLNNVLGQFNAQMLQEIDSGLYLLTPEMVDQLNGLTPIEAELFESQNQIRVTAQNQLTQELDYFSFDRPTDDIPNTNDQLEYPVRLDQRPALTSQNPAEIQSEIEGTKNLQSNLEQTQYSSVQNDQRLENQLEDARITERTFQEVQRHTENAPKSQDETLQQIKIQRAKREEERQKQLAEQIELKRRFTLKQRKEEMKMRAKLSGKRTIAKNTAIAAATGFLSTGLVTVWTTIIR